MRARGNGAGRPGAPSLLCRGLPRSVGWPGGAAPAPQNFLPGSRTGRSGTFSAWGLCAGPAFIPAPRGRLQAHGILQPLAPQGPCPPTTVSSGPVLPGALLPAHARACRASGRASASSRCLSTLCLVLASALPAGEIPASLDGVFLSFRLNFCCSPPAAPSCRPAGASSSPGAWAAQREHGDHGHPSASPSTAVPARQHPSPWPVPDGALLARPVCSEEENVLPRAAVP